MSVKLYTGSYPQISGRFAELNTESWDEKTLLAKGHRLLEVRLKEVTLNCEGSTRSYNQIEDSEIPGLAKIKYALTDSTFRTSFQWKTTLRADMTKITLKQLEDSLIAEIRNRAVEGKHNRNKYKVRIEIESIITEHGGNICWWARIDKDIDGIKMILAYLNDKHVGKMSKQHRADAMDMTWMNEVCDIAVTIFVKEARKVSCGNSGRAIKQ